MSSETVTARLAGGYPFTQLDRLIRGLAPLLSLNERRAVVLDLAGLVFISPSGLALLVATMKRLEDLALVGEGGYVHLPKSPMTRNYVMRMDFLRNLPAAEPLEEPFARKKAVGFRPVLHFIGDEEYAQVATEFTNALVERVPTDNLARASIRICLDELAENVVHHAYTDLGGFAAAQGWKKSCEFEIGIVDLGVGVRESLTKNPDYADIKDDATAISTALEPRVSSTPERNSGIGLFVTQRLLRENGGTLVVRSGTGAVWGGAHEEVRRNQAPLPGTLVALRARTDRPLNLRAIYRDLPGDIDEDD